MNTTNVMRDAEFDNWHRFFAVFLIMIFAELQKLLTIAATSPLPCMFVCKTVNKIMKRQLTHAMIHSRDISVRTAKNSHFCQVAFQLPNVQERNYWSVWNLAAYFAFYGIWGVLKWNTCVNRPIGPHTVLWCSLRITNFIQLPVPRYMCPAFVSSRVKQFKVRIQEATLRPDIGICRCGGFHIHVLDLEPLWVIDIIEHKLVTDRMYRLWRLLMRQQRKGNTITAFRSQRR